MGYSKQEHLLAANENEVGDQMVSHLVSNITTTI